MTRFATAAFLGCLFLVPFGLSTDCPTQDHPEPSSPNLCTIRDAVSGEPISVDDDAIQAHLERQGGRLVESGNATPMTTLLKGLARVRCQVHLDAVQLACHDAGEIYREVRQSIVVVSSIYKCGDCSKWHGSTATGFVISASGVVVTNHHVVDMPEDQTLVVMTAEQTVIPVTRILAASKSDDLAILQVDSRKLVPLPVAASPAPVGSDICVISHPAQRFYSYTSGVVSRYTATRSGRKMVDCMTVTADYARGSSGAPVLNESGEVVGIVMSTDSIYYSVERGQQKNLQMVFKTCIPSASLLKLIAVDGAS